MPATLHPLQGGVSALALSAAATYAGKGIRVNCVAPGLTRTGLSERITSECRCSSGGRPLWPVVPACLPACLPQGPAPYWIPSWPGCPDGSHTLLPPLLRPRQPPAGSEAALKASAAMHALRRIGEPAEVAAAIEFLLHPSNSWITGQVLGVDGGLGSVRPA